MTLAAYVTLIQICALPQKCPNVPLPKSLTLKEKSALVSLGLYWSHNMVELNDLYQWAFSIWNIGLYHKLVDITYGADIADSTCEGMNDLD